MLLRRHREKTAEQVVKQEPKKAEEEPKRAKPSVK